MLNTLLRDYHMENVLIYLPLSSILFAVLAVLYSKLRPFFPVRVNCWFCHKDLMVHYHERNSWDCPHCEQYNGFNEDGGYNKVIPAQFNALMNPEPKSQGNVFQVQGELCQSCLLNQELKIRQISRFSPVNERSFNSEYDEFRSHLDQSYRLCKNCQSKLEEKLAREERALKPGILAWKLELSKKLNSKKSCVSIKKSSLWIRATKSIEYLSGWTILVCELAHHWIINYDIDGLFVNSVLMFEAFCSKLLPLAIIGAGCSILNIWLSGTKLVLNVCRTVMWTLMIFSSVVSFGFDVLWLPLGLNLLCFIDMVPGLIPKLRKSQKLKLKSLNRKNSSYLKNESMNSSVSSGLHHSTPKMNPPWDLDMSKLDIGPKCKSISPNSVRSTSRNPSPGFVRPKPLISPSRLSNINLSPSNGHLTKASWVAGGYWHSNNWQSPTFTAATPNYSYPLSRSSSQSSGFGSIQTALNNRSPPDSRPGSPFAEIDRLSVFSGDNYEPRYAESNLKYPEPVSSPSSAYQVQNQPSRQSVVSSPSVIEQEIKTTAANSTSLWFVVSFILGFSLAINLCLVYYIMH